MALKLESLGKMDLENLLFSKSWLEKIMTFKVVRPH